MAVSNIKTTLQSDIHKVWEVVLAVENYTWRSDLSSTKVVNGTQFIEYTKAGYPTTLTVTAAEPYKRWEFDMENTNIKEHWVGCFASTGNATEINFTEFATAKKLFLKPFLKSFLKKQQAQFVADLRKALDC